MATLTEITKALEAAVGDAERRAESVAIAKANLTKAEENYAALRGTIQKLHAEYEAYMNKVLSFGGTVHR